MDGELLLVNKFKRKSRTRIDDQRDRHLERTAALGRCFDSLVKILRLRDLDSGSFISAAGPSIGWVRLLDVNRVEIGAVLQPAVNFFQDSRLESKGASREAAEDQHERFLVP